MINKQLFLFIETITNIVGEGNLIFCCTGSRDSYFGLVDRQNIDNNLNFQGRHN